jgi:hypothetical protein
MRGHNPILIEEFNGLWARGDAESVPLDHFSDCSNIKFIQSGFATRDGVSSFQIGDSTFDVENVVRQYLYVHNRKESLLVLDIDGNIFHTGSPTPLTPILTIAAMKDFALSSIAGRAYISPNDGNMGLRDEPIYVYLGDGTPARKSGGPKPTGSSFAAGATSDAGNMDLGIHIYAVVYETDTGFLTALGPDVFPSYNSIASTKVALTNIPISPDSFVVARRIASTKAINPALYKGDTKGYQFFFIPDGRIADNTTTSLEVNYFDADLLDDASHLLDIFDHPPSGVALNTYHGRLVSVAEYGDPNDKETTGNISIARVSEPGEPEAFNKISGLIIAPLDDKPLTNAQEYRDVLYLFKQTRTFAYNDNGDDPSGWPLTIIDQGIGASIHGIASVLDSGGVNIDYLMIADYSGIMLFNGSYIRPELSWKVSDDWLLQERSLFNRIQMMNDSLSQILYLTLPGGKMLIGNYSNGLDPQKIRWAPWLFNFKISTITLIDTNKLVLGSDGDFS